MFRSLGLSAMVAAFALGNPVLGVAAILQVTVTGTIDYVSEIEGGPYDDLEPPAGIGDPMTMVYLYDDQSLDSDSSPARGIYDLISLTVTIPGLSYVYSPANPRGYTGTIAIRDLGGDDGGTPYMVQAFLDDFGSDPVPYFAEIWWYDNNCSDIGGFCSPLVSDALVAPPLTWSAWMRWGEDTSTAWSFRAGADSVAVQVVPIPPVGWIVGLAFGLIGIRRSAL